MREIIDLIESAAVQEPASGALYHGTAIFRLGSILAMNVLDGVQADGTSGVSLTSDYDVAQAFAAQREEQVQCMELSYEFSKPATPFPGDGATIEFDGALIAQHFKLRPYNQKHKKYASEKEFRLRGAMKPVSDYIVSIHAETAAIKWYVDFLQNPNQQCSLDLHMVASAREGLISLLKSGLLR